MSTLTDELATVLTDDLIIRRDVLYGRLEKGWEPAERSAKAYDKWHGLLDEYEAVCDELRERGVRPREIVAIIGSRAYLDLDAVRRYVDALPDSTLVISGGARGVDTVAIEAAKARGLPTHEYRPDTSIPSPARFHVRNRQIGDACTRMAAFWDGTSSGTRGAVEYTRSLGKPVEVMQP